MPRFHIQEIDGPKDLVSTEPVIVTGWLIVTNGSNDAVLVGVDFDGDIFPPAGLTVKGQENWGGANLHLVVKPTITFTLTGTGSQATIYYENLKWSVDWQYP